MPNADGGPVLSEATLKALAIDRALDSMTDALVLFDQDWRIVYANRNVESLVHRSPAQLIGRNHWELFPDTLGTEIEERYRRAIRTGDPEHFDFFFPPLDRWFELHAHPIPDGLAVYFRDITARRNADEALKQSRQRLIESEAQLQLITDALPAYVAYIDHTLRYVRVNRTCVEWFGRAASDLIGRTIFEVLGDAAQVVRPHLEGALRGEPQQFEAVFQTVTQPRILRISHIPDRDAHGMVRGVIVHGRDITERRQAQIALRESEERFRRLSASSPVGIFQATIEGSVTYLNPQTERIFALPQAGLLGHGWLTRLHPDDVDRVAAEWAAANAAGQPYETEYRLLLAEGEIRDVRAQTAILFDDRGAPSGVVGTVDDITSRRRAQEALRQSEKLAAVGRLASSIAHEINNPLEAVTNLLYLSRHSADLVEIQGYLDLAERELRRVSAIANQTLRFHKQSSRPRLAGCEELIGNSLSVYQGRLVNSSIDVRKRKRASCPVLCFDGEIRQVLNNLIGNAIDAMQAGGGRLYLRSRDATRWRTGEKGLAITVADTGPGMSATTVARIFEPFFTTKGIGGTGLGLWISQDIVARHMGLIAVRSSQRPGRSGTVFSFFLPFNAPLRPDPTPAIEA